MHELCFPFPTEKTHSAHTDLEDCFKLRPLLQAGLVLFWFQRGSCVNLLKGGHQRSLVLQDLFLHELL